MKRVLVPVDHKGLDEVTQGFANNFAINMGAVLHVVTVLPYSDRSPHSPMTHFIVMEEKSFIDESRATIANAVKQLADAGVHNIVTAILKGDPASEIIDYADREKCDMILIHSHGMGIVKRFAIGSVTNTIVLHSNVPVLVIK